MNQEKPSNKDLTKALKQEALKMAVSCVRNTIIENYHAGIVPKSKTGDYSDVKVITPYGEIPWNELSRISDPEMMAFNKEVVNNLYAYLHCLVNPDVDPDLKETLMKYASDFYPSEWDEPQIPDDLKRLVEKRKQGK
mgnify:CR=1 FL=1